MKRFLRKSSFVLLAAVSLLLTGCGSRLSQLTAEEEEMFVAFSAGVVSKANQKQSQGLTYLPKEVPEEEESADTSRQAENTTAKAEPEEEQAAVPNKTTPETEQAVDAQAVSATPKATLTKALGISKIRATYKRYEVADYYMEGNAAAMNATPGNTFIILHITLANTSKIPINCDIRGRHESSQLLINGVPAASAMSTIMMSDLTQYNENMGGGTKAKTVLIFQVNKDMTKNIKTLSMECNIGGNQYSIALKQ